jgi:hypothetical protein
VILLPLFLSLSFCVAYTLENHVGLIDGRQREETVSSDAADTQESQK